MIPKIFHHIWVGNNAIPNICLQCIQVSKSLHRDFEFKMWTDVDIDELLKSDYPEYYSYFHRLPRTIMKIDMFRYFLMHKFGGVYTDLDYFFMIN